MAEKVSLPSPHAVTLQAELQRAKSQLEQERNLLQHKEAQHRASLQAEVKPVVSARGMCDRFAGAQSTEPPWHPHLISMKSPA